MAELKAGAITVHFPVKGTDEDGGEATLQVTINSTNGVEFRIRSRFKAISIQQDDARHMLNTINQFLPSPKRDLDHVARETEDGSEDPG